MKALRILLIAALLCMVAAVTANAQEEVLKVWLAECDAGPHITDTNGMTLYWFGKDTPGKSVCEGPCLEKWPVFYQEKIATDGRTKAEDYGTITRADGKLQTTYKGYPLYYFFNDKKPGETHGYKYNNIWFVINPDTFPQK